MKTNGKLGPPALVQLFLYSQKNPEFFAWLFSRETKNYRKWNSPLPWGNSPPEANGRPIIWRMGFRKEHNVNLSHRKIQSPTRQWMMVWGVLHHLRNAKYLFRFHKTSLKRWARISRVLRRLRFSGQKRCRVPRLRRCSIMTALRQCSKICCKWS